MVITIQSYQIDPPYQKVNCLPVFLFQDGTDALTGGPNGGGPDNSFALMAMAWVMLAVVMFMMRPTSFRTPPNKPAERRDDDDDHDQHRDRRQDEPPAAM